MGNVRMMPTTSRPVTEQGPVKYNSLSNEKSTETEYDIFRDSWVRYLGYTNEVGEAFRRHISRKLLTASYAIATTYVCADTIDKAHRSLSKGRSYSQTFITAGDAFVWQMFASILIPSYVINRITYFTRRLVRMKRKKCICKASPIVRYTPVAVGLLAIPFIIHPIDWSVTWAMDRTLRTLNSDPESDKPSQAKDPKSTK